MKISRKHDYFVEIMMICHTRISTSGHLRAGVAGWQIPEAHKVPFFGVFWRQGDTERL